VGGVNIIEAGSVEGPRRDSMKRWGWASLLIAALLIATVAPSEAGGRHHHRHGHGRVFIGLGLGFGPGWYGYPYYGYPYYPYWYYPPPAYAYPAPVVQQPTVYVEQKPVPPAGSAPAAAQQYWYYCESAAGYYPSVESCPEPWVKVPARP
jgi:hypothetical protein